LASKLAGWSGDALTAPKLARGYQPFGSVLCNLSTLTYNPAAEFKEIRKEWKARKKEEENMRKADEERARAAAVGSAAEGQPGEGAPAPGYQQAGRPPVQLPPIGYQPGAHVPGQYQAAPSGGVQQLQEYPNNGQIQYSGYPASPYGAPTQMYNQRHYTLSYSPLQNYANIVNR
jgi:transcription factor CON7